tara:strand:- start:125365 stop:125535 length:171 start_codon:yes stop_codon:yes gene_type:complete
MASNTPISCNAFSFSNNDADRDTSMPSVISNSNAQGGNPLAANTRCVMVMKSGCSN